MPPKIRALLELSRVSNLPTVASNVIAAWVIAGGGFDLLILLVLAGGGLLYSGGMVLNDAVDREFDRQHRPERPIPSGVISVVAAFGFAIAFLGFGAGFLVLGGSHPLLVALLVLAVVLYDILHKRWQGSIYVMGACRLLLYLAAASAAEDWLSLPVIAWGCALGIYTAGITLAARGETSDAKVNWMGFAFLGCPLIAAILVAVIGKAEPLPLWCFVAVWLGWTLCCVVVLRGKAEGRVGRAVGLLIAGMLLIDACAVAASYWWLALVLVAALPVVLFWQKKIAAT